MRNYRSWNSWCNYSCAGGSATATVANGGTDAEATFNFAFGLPTGATGSTGAWYKLTTCNDLE